MSASLLTCAYLLGSIPFALLLGLARGVDIRKLGSGNVGATNLARAAGRKWGMLGFVLDFAKGLLPVLLAVWLEASGRASALGGANRLPVAVGLLAIVGHVFPIFLRFRGGKGVATTFGVMTGLSWPSSLVAGALWLLLYRFSRTVSIASLGLAAALPLAVAVFEREQPGYALTLVFSIVIGLLIIWRHRSNIARLLSGEEPSFGSKK